MPEIARALRRAVSTVAVVLKRLAWNRLPPAEPLAHRSEADRRGELLHVDIEKLRRFGQVGPRIHGRRQRRARGLGWDCVHAGIAGHGGLADAAVLRDVHEETAAGFLDRAGAWERSRGDRARASADRQRLLLPLEAPGDDRRPRRAAREPEPALPAAYPCEG